jgi:uncharacterized protein (TIGR02680 family)
MPDSLFLGDAATDSVQPQPALPEPVLNRWQPLRVGLVELFHYDSEEFWFRDGHLLLRGNNGTGKSKVLSLTLPFLFDANLKSSRIEPDGDPGKKMAWNLLLGKHERRVGYAWIELGRVGEDGVARYLTLGAGLSAVAARSQVDSWFFITEQQRPGRDLWLINQQRAVLGKDRLALALQGRGQVFDTAAGYRRAVDERLFHLGETRYGALMDTLIQLRQPQLSKKPNEDNLSNALTEALPPLADDLLGDVAEAMNQLEEHAQQLSELAALGKAIGQFNGQYQRYARVNARRQARVLRSAETGFGKASRELAEARVAFEAAARAEAAQRAALAASEEQHRRDRAALDEMLSDPLMRDANRLEELERNVAARRADLQVAHAALQASEERGTREADTLRASSERAAAACAALERARTHAADAASAAGLATRDDYQAADRAFAEPATLAGLAETDYMHQQQRVRALAAQRRADIALLEDGLRRADDAGRARAAEQRARDERADDLADAGVRVAAAEERLERGGAALVDAWREHGDGLRQLPLPEPDAVLAALSDWVRTLDGDNPAQAALAAAEREGSLRLAGHEAELRQQARTLAGQRGVLEDERSRLAQGEDKQPPVPHRRAVDARRAGRPGAAFWQLVEFRADRPIGESERAGLEAALEAAGLLDAWVAPDGQVSAARDLFDTLLQSREPQAQSLADWLEPATAAAVAPEQVQRLLRSIACGTREDERAEAWVGPDGRFRVGPVAGKWGKSAADYIGAASRAQARRRRLAEIGALLEDLGRQQAQLEAGLQQVAARRELAAREWRDAPSDTGVRAAHVEVRGEELQRRQAAERLAQADLRLAAAAERWRQAREQVRVDAADLGLPADADGLSGVAAALVRLDDALQDLLLQGSHVRHALPERARQAARVEELQQDAAARREQLAQRHDAHEEAASRLHSLLDRVGAQVDELKMRLAGARQAVLEGEGTLVIARKALEQAATEGARSEQRAGDAERMLEERSDARQQAVQALEHFSGTGLLAVALPELDAPRSAWGIDTALGVARRTEQALHEIGADDADWTRVQSAFSHDYSELLRALTALGHQAQAETSDFGMIVTIVYQNRAQRPDLIEASIREEIVQRRELLTARETEVLENHLQAEVAAAIQRMLREAEARLQAINGELAKRPTSTGVKFRLVWQALPEGPDGAPVGLDAARKRLLNTSFDAWSPQDRQVVGTMLQDRISAERTRVEGEGGSLLDMLGRALDYRRWHRFRVQRWQDGQWRPLSGPASSGERALGLTVPLFAAVSSFYTHGGSRHAPRLVLLDEAFAGIDDAARAHCMALVREFDLDFVMTSEREWACYAELPGVSICQLQRHEGIDAVHVSRWTWDGKVSRAERDGARRFPPAADVGGA